VVTLSELIQARRVLEEMLRQWTERVYYDSFTHTQLGVFPDLLDPGFRGPAPQSYADQYLTDQTNYILSNGTESPVRWELPCDDQACPMCVPPTDWTHPTSTPEDEFNGLTHQQKKDELDRRIDSVLAEANPRLPMYRPR
jgi:hypothetical protein